jgi:hypothetical protein
MVGFMPNQLTVDLISSLDGYAAAEGWPGYWGLEIVAEQGDPNFGRVAEIPKVVLSSTLRPPLTWANTRVVGQDAVTAVGELKESGPTPLTTLGSPTYIPRVVAREGRAFVRKGARCG